MKNIENSWYRISAKAIIFNEKWEFLLCKESNWTWDLPWGGIDHNELPIDCLARELKEEMWLVASYINEKPLYFITAHKPTSKSRPWIANVCYETELENLDFTKSDECVEIWFFNIKEAKKLNLLINVEALLKEMQAVEILRQ